jgi:hypothetical protein
MDLLPHTVPHQTAQDAPEAPFPPGLAPDTGPSTYRDSSRIAVVYVCTGPRRLVAGGPSRELATRT